jgi:predicted Ser/Thr protein kinase
MPDNDPYGATQTFPGDADNQSATELCTHATDGSRTRAHPARIGRFRVESVLGKGGFGFVYLAHDDQLDRAVAIKVPHANLISQPEDADVYLAEARTVANLDHPHIVPVYDIGSAEECRCFIVAKYVEGADLATKIREGRFKYAESAELVATVADALHYAHKQGLVHRDRRHRPVRRSDFRRGHPPARPRQTGRDAGRRLQGRQKVNRPDGAFTCPYCQTVWNEA